jgi:glycosyltransferase involved in cell wall biosynthesis
MEAIANGENGRLVDFFDRRALVETIVELCNDPQQRKRLGAAARTVAIERYDFRTRILPRYNDLLDRLMT